MGSLTKKTERRRKVRNEKQLKNRQKKLRRKLKKKTSWA